LQAREIVSPPRHKERQGFSGGENYAGHEKNYIEFNPKSLYNVINGLGFGCPTRPAYQFNPRSPLKGELDEETYK
jgi:hypothetical protein